MKNPLKNVFYRSIRNRYQKKKKIFFLFLFFFIIFSVFEYRYLITKSINNYKDFYQNIYYILLFLYTPFTFITMEMILKNSEIKGVLHLPISNKKIVSFLLFKTFFIETIYLIMIIILLYPLSFHSKNLFLATITQILVYHFMFLSISFWVYGYVCKVILDKKYDEIKKVLNGGWTDPELTPFLFAPGVIFGVVNIVNIIVSKTIESFFFEIYVDPTIFYIIIGLIPIGYLLGRKELIKYLDTVYAKMNVYQHLYQDGSYIVEKSFWEERILSKFTKLYPSFYKDLRIIKRGFRVRVLLSYFAPFIIFLTLYFNLFNNDLRFKVFITIFFIFGISPSFKLFYSPIESNSSLNIYPITHFQFYLSKIIISFLIFSPYWGSFIIFGIVFKNIVLISLAVFYLLSPIIWIKIRDQKLSISTQMAIILMILFVN